MENNSHEILQHWQKHANLSGDRDSDTQRPGRYRNRLEAHLQPRHRVEGVSRGRAEPIKPAPLKTASLFDEAAPGVTKAAPSAESEQGDEPFIENEEDDAPVDETEKLDDAA
jgi:hypothetical protein